MSEEEEGELSQALKNYKPAGSVMAAGRTWGPLPKLVQEYKDWKAKGFPDGFGGQSAKEAARHRMKHGIDSAGQIAGSVMAGSLPKLVQEYKDWKAKGFPDGFPGEQDATMRKFAADAAEGRPGGIPNQTDEPDADLGK